MSEARRIQDLLPLTKVPERKSISEDVVKCNISQIPSGLEALYAACQKLYPDQLNPLQVAAVVKYWLGGPDPLDYVSMFYNPGNEEQIPPHWHYVSFGLSDLHGDGRVHELSKPDQPSGFGFELTMRVSYQEGEKTPPIWPATLMQGLAKYIFQSVEFVQIVGITAEELETAQHWNGCGILDIMRRFPETGGEWLITNMKRGESIFDLDPLVEEEVDEGIAKDGSNLSGVAANVSWQVYDIEEEESPEDEIARKIAGESVIERKDGRSELEDETVSEEPVIKSLPSIQLLINAEAGSLLPLALKGRLKHGRHFTFKSKLTSSVVTLLSPNVDGAFASSESPYSQRGSWVQIWIGEDLLNEMIEKLNSSSDAENIKYPVCYEWPHKKLKITIC